MLHFDRTPSADFDALLAEYNDADLASATRSTVPLLSLLRHGGDVWARIVTGLGMPSGEPAVHAEYTVPPARGRGRPSHTDAMLIQAGRSCAVEAKWTEPPYATVADWLGPDGGSENRGRVLEGWLSLLQPHAAGELRVEDVQGVIYQMVHRAASACAVAASPALAYLLFTPGPDGSPSDAGYIRDSLTRLAEAIGHPATLPFHVVTVEMHPTSAFERIRRLPKGQPSTGQAVRAALAGPPLFEFTGHSIERISGSS